MHISPIGAPTARTYEGGIEQSLLSEHLIFKTSFFHNEFGKQIEYVGLDLIPQLLPSLSPAQQAALEQQLQADFAYELTLNTEAYRAMGVESTLESGIGRYIFLRGGYTYLDAVIQRSYTNDDVELLGPVPTYNGIPIGYIFAAGGCKTVSEAAAYWGSSRPVIRGAGSRCCSIRHLRAGQTTLRFWADMT